MADRVASSIDTPELRQRAEQAADRLEELLRKPTYRVWKDPNAAMAACISSLVGGEDMLDRYAYEPNTLTSAHRRQITRFLRRHGPLVIELLGRRLKRRMSA